MDSVFAILEEVQKHVPLMSNTSGVLYWLCGWYICNIMELPHEDFEEYLVAKDPRFLRDKKTAEKIYYYFPVVFAATLNPVAGV